MRIYLLYFWKACLLQLLLMRGPQQPVYVIIIGTCFLLSCIYTYFETVKRKRLDKTDALIKSLRTEHADGIAGWKLLHYAGTAPGAGPNRFYGGPSDKPGTPPVFYTLEEWLAKERDHYQALMRLCDVFNHAGYLASQKQIDLLLLRSEFGQQMDTLHEWFDTLPGTSPGMSLMASEYPYYHRLYAVADQALW